MIGTQYAHLSFRVGIWRYPMLYIKGVMQLLAPEKIENTKFYQEDQHD